MFGLKRHEFQAKLQAAPRIPPEVLKRGSPKHAKKRGRRGGTLHKFNKTVLSASLGNDFLCAVLGYLDDSGEVLLAGEVGGHFLDEDEVDRGVGGVHSGDA